MNREERREAYRAYRHSCSLYGFDALTADIAVLEVRHLGTADDDPGIYDAARRRLTERRFPDALAGFQIPVRFFPLKPHSVRWRMVADAADDLTRGLFHRDPTSRRLVEDPGGLTGRCACELLRVGISGDLAAYARMEREKSAGFDCRTAHHAHFDALLEAGLVR
ncbi:hypothetical protein AB0F20_09985 [Streptomyces goshikiensis]|uniref:hypothetical protein n=1 Tax=Streptomyces goshikiensis TaxID=1942 RepID=UPI003411C95A